MKNPVANEKTHDTHRIVSSAHLAAGASPGLSEVEFSLTLAVTAYHRWMVRCMTAAGMPSLSPLEVLILHTVRHRDRPKSMGDIALVLDIEETHLATYAIRKLNGLGLVTTTRRGQEKIVTATAEGIALCDRYGALREKLLVSALSESGVAEDRLSAIASLLRSLSGFYNQAARAAATL
ncbi:winged helix DNA-binding protein [Acidocella sp.]|jgi:predicted MarR family transcription regulator|uniref:winged helix DNA-binding protein n=1 Tax=Acidocella sp. TaxID=50710 RepID=UPI002F3EC186